MMTAAIENKRCTRCKRELPLTEFHRDKNRACGHKSLCRSCCSRRDKEYYRNNESYRTRKRPVGKEGSTRTSLKKNLQSYKIGAARRNLSWSLTDEEALSLMRQDCAYCAALPSGNGDGGIAKNGIDRIDSSLGYEPENCLPCCSECNYAKQAMGLSEIEERMRRLENIHKKLSQYQKPQA